MTCLPFANAQRILARTDATVIDLRSPAEFAVDHFPGAFNIPLFDNDQRAIVGTLYKQSSPSEAFAQGVEFVVDKIEQLVSEVGKLAKWEPPTDGAKEHVQKMTAPGFDGFRSALKQAFDAPLPERPVAFYCWRGGMRSMSVIALMHAMGLERVVGLERGYKGYRKHVMAEIADWQAPRSFALRGLTGVGKTLVLREIESIRPGWTVDLEGLAGHRSSLLGSVGLHPVSQKTFESRVAQRLRAGFPGEVAVFEMESRKVGSIIVPEPVWKSLRAAKVFDVVADTKHRVRVLREDYLGEDGSVQPLRVKLAEVEALVKPAQPLLELYDAERYDDVILALLKYHYDPLYRQSHGASPSARFRAEDCAKAAREMVDWIEADMGEEPS
jgi:tRNA 2-selenouridine synthase